MEPSGRNRWQALANGTSLKAALLPNFWAEAASARPFGDAGNRVEGQLDLGPDALLVLAPTRPRSPSAVPRGPAHSQTQRGRREAASVGAVASAST
jgi:hypothetical protein